MKEEPANLICLAFRQGKMAAQGSAGDLYVRGAAMSFSAAIRGSPARFIGRTERPVVRFEDVAIRYGSGPDVLSGISFHLRPGSFHFVAGPSGSGKSSLLRTMFLANDPADGRMLLFGRDSTSLSRDERALFRRQIGVVFQDFRLLPHLTVAENVALPLRIASRREDKVREHVAELLAWVGLGESADNLPATLSGGQQQRVAIARAVIGQPNLILADEPTGNVDHRHAMRLLYLFDELNKIGTTVVIATHSRDLIERFKHPILRLGDGTVRVEKPATSDGPTAVEGSVA